MIRIDKIIVWTFPLILASIFILYYFVNPHYGGFPLRCPWQLLTGTQCPSCGIQRALHAMVHGRVIEALKYNYFFVLSIPYAFLAVISQWYNPHHRFDRLRALVFHRLTLRIYAFLFCFWWIVRNILCL